MTIEQKIELKNKILLILNQMVEDQISIAQTMLSEAYEAVANDTKSTAGDKHETSRAMAQIEQEKAGVQLIKAQRMKSLLRTVKADIFDSVQLGAIVYTSSACFFISQAFGKVIIEKQPIFCVSPGSPIVQEMLNLKAEDSFVVNGRKQTITKIF